MRRTSPVLLAALAAGVLAAPAAASAAGLGTVDTQRLLREYKGAQSAQSDLRNQAQSYQRDLMELSKKLDEAQKAGKKPDELARMRAQDEARLAPRKERIERLEREQSARIKTQVEGVIRQVAQGDHLDYVVDKQAVLYGGRDITDEVLRRLNH